MPKKYLPAQTFRVYESISAELDEIRTGFEELSTNPSIKKTHMQNAAKKLTTVVKKFVTEELELIDPSDRLLPAEVYEYRYSMPYRHDIETDPTVRVWDRWQVLYKFLAKRVVEYRFSDMSKDSYEKFEDKYGLSLVSIHELVCKSGLPALAKGGS